jgi:hypothetical protein
MWSSAYLLVSKMIWIAEKFPHLLLRNDQPVGFSGWTA